MFEDSHGLADAPRRYVRLAAEEPTFMSLGIVSMRGRGRGSERVPDAKSWRRHCLLGEDSAFQDLRRYTLWLLLL